MPGERGQASVEWIAVIAVVAISLAALARSARRDEDHGLATALVHSVTCAARDGCPHARAGRIRGERRGESRSPGAEAFTAPPLVPDRAGRQPRPRGRFTARPLVRDPAARRARPGGRPPIGRRLLEWARRQVGRELGGWVQHELPGRLRTGAGRAWRTAWFGCLVYERARWAVLHPESRDAEYELPPSEALRMVNDCISPVDLVRDWPLLTVR